MKFASSLAETGTLNIMLAIWIPNVIYALIALGLFVSVPE
jgi:lipopolysaccharide export LptBFGC system permease protein LptF